MTQEPHKHPHYVSLLLHLSRGPPRSNPEDGIEPQTGEKRKAVDGLEDDANCGREVLEDLNRAFRDWVEARQWLNARLCVGHPQMDGRVNRANGLGQLQFFSLLVPAGLVSAVSLLEVYKSLLSVLNEVGGGGERAERVTRAVGEGLIRVSHLAMSCRLR